MKSRSISHWGFWLAVGVATGLLISDLTDPPAAHAIATSRYEDFIMATGASEFPDVDVVWVLDYTGARLICLTLNRQGKFAGKSELDLLQTFQGEEGGGGGRPHFMMVTGRYRTQTISDILYVIETTSGKIMAVTVPALDGATLRPIGAPRALDVISYVDEK